MSKHYLGENPHIIFHTRIIISYSIISRMMWCDVVRCGAMWCDCVFRVTREDKMVSNFLASA